MSSERTRPPLHEAAFRLSFDAIADLIVVATPEGRILFINRAASHALGYDPADLGAMSVLDLHPADRRQEAQANLAAMIRGERSRCSVPLASKDGALVSVDTRVWPGEWNGAGCIFHMSEKVSPEPHATPPAERLDLPQTEAKLAKALAFQREVTRLATDFVNVPLERQDAAIDLSLATMGQLLSADRAHLFTLDLELGIVTNTHEWCSPGIMPAIGGLQAVHVAKSPDWTAPYRRGETFRVVAVEALPEDSAMRHMLESHGIRSLISQPLMQGDTCVGAVGVETVREQRTWQDEEIQLLQVMAELYVHFEGRRAMELETRTLQARLIEARDEANAAARAKGLFLANMSHEIRTPLNAILGYAQIMERECRPCPMKQRLEVISRSGEHLLQLITDLLELVRSDGRIIGLVPSTFSLRRVLDDVRHLFAGRPGATGLRIEMYVAPDVPPMIHADQGKVVQVLTNLVGNAIKFTEQGSVRVSACIKADGGPDGLTLAVDVEDTGCGIANDELERVFDLFYSGQHSPDGAAGTGLGLSLSRQYARALGGDVTASSRLGVGSRFVFTFKARDVSGADAERQIPGTVRRLAPGQPPFHILAVDDDRASCDMLAAMLESVGFEVETVASAPQALRRLRAAEEIGLVLMDKRMPGMSGYEAIARIRHLPRGRSLSVVVVTASGLIDEGEEAMAAGADGYVSKPVRRDQLLAEIGRVTGVKYDLEVALPAALVAAEPPVVDAKTLACLSPDLRLALASALRRGDIGQMRSLVEEIARDHAGLAAGIHRFVDTYDYDRLRRLLEPAKGDAS